MDNEKCKFAPYQNVKMCQILMGEKCDGYRLKCSFRKTEAEFNESLKKAILLNRKKGNCYKCQYTKTECKISE